MQTASVRDKSILVCRVVGNARSFILPVMVIAMESMYFRRDPI